jgi:uncharacterized membrane protein
MTMAFMTRIFVPLVLLLISLSSQAQESQDLESNAKHIIEKRCFSCHNSDLKTAGLVLTSREQAIKGGKSGPAVVPNRPDQSLIVRKIFAGQMPPGDPLPDQEREVICKWIESGAPCNLGELPTAEP